LKDLCDAAGTSCVKGIWTDCEGGENIFCEVVGNITVEGMIM
jgi:hypothetical protein